MRAGAGRLSAGWRAGLWAAVAVGAAVSAGLSLAGPLAGGTTLAGRPPSATTSPGGQRQAAGQGSRDTAGTFVPAARDVPVARLAASSPVLAPLGRRLAADLLIVAPRALPRRSLRAVGRLPGVLASEQVDAARIRLDGRYVAMLGVDPSRFRAFAAGPTARAVTLWRNVAAGGVAVSYLMGKQDRLPLGGVAQLAGKRTLRLRVAGFGTVGIAGVDAVVSGQVARALGMPAGNAAVISAPHARLSVLMTEIRRVVPAGTSVVPLVAQAALAGLPVTPGSAGGPGITAADGPGLTGKQARAFLAAALSRTGDPYVWGGAGPRVFDCSGLVQWSMRQAGVVMPRVAADQARTGPLVPLSLLQPGDLLFYHTDPTAPEYISHVAIYLGHGEMLQAPQPGMDVQVVPAVFGGGFAGAVAVYPRLAAAVARGTGAG